MDTLPVEIITYLQSFLTREDLLNFRITCTYVNNSPRDVEQNNRSKFLREHKKIFAGCLRRIRRIYYDIKDEKSCRYSDKIWRLYESNRYGLSVESSNQRVIDRVFEYNYKYMYANIGTYVNDNDKQYVTERPVFYHYAYADNYTAYINSDGKKYKMKVLYSVYIHYAGKNRGLGFVREDNVADSDQELNEELI